jgi:hypothetical protein
VILEDIEINLQRENLIFDTEKFECTIRYNARRNRMQTQKQILSKMLHFIH